jgi:excisionase family DNA binding protein
MVRDPLIPRLVSTAEAGDIIGRSRQQVNNLINEGKLPAARVGTTLVIAEETVRRYAAGERFGFPTLLLVYTYDDAAGGWVEARRQAVQPDYELPAQLEAQVFGEVADRTCRVELVDNHGKILAARTVEAEVARDGVRLKCD